MGSLYAASTAVHQLPLDITVCSRALRHAALDVLVYPEVHKYCSRHSEPLPCRSVALPCACLSCSLDASDGTTLTDLLPSLVVF
jgi:hypothetical protein